MGTSMTSNDMKGGLDDEAAWKVRDERRLSDAGPPIFTLEGSPSPRAMITSSQLTGTSARLSFSVEDAGRKGFIV